MKEKILSVISFGLVAYSLVSIGYTALPVEIKEMIPQFNDLTALITGGSSGVIGGAGLYFKSMLLKHTSISEEKVNTVVDKFVVLVSKYNELKENYNEMKKSYNDMKEETVKLQDLIKADIQLKLSNPLIEESKKALVEGVLNEK